jgi:acyl carrier protein
MTNSVRDAVRLVMADVLKLDAEIIGDDASMETVAEWDSGNHVSLVLALEEEFGVSFEVPEIEATLSLEDVVATLESKL